MRMPEATQPNKRHMLCVHCCLPQTGTRTACLVRGTCAHRTQLTHRPNHPNTTRNTSLHSAIRPQVSPRLHYISFSHNLGHRGSCVRRFFVHSRCESVAPPVECCQWLLSPPRLHFNFGGLPWKHLLTDCSGYSKGIGDSWGFGIRLHEIPRWRFSRVVALCRWGCSRDLWIVWPCGGMSGHLQRPRPQR